MFERYTDRARRVVFFARYETSKFGSKFITPEHLLLGLIREDKKALELIVPQPATIQLIEKELRDQQSAAAGKPISMEADLPLSDPGKHVLRYAAEEADQLGNLHIGTEHLALALLRETSSDAAKVLQKYGADLAVVRNRMQGENRQPSPVSTEIARPREVQTVEVMLELSDAATGSPIALIALPPVIPALGEEIAFTDEVPVRRFRVVKVTYALESLVTRPQGVSKKLAKILVSVEPLEK